MSEISTLKVIKNDFGAFLLAIFGPISLIISGYVAVTGVLPRFRGRGGGAVDPETNTLFLVASAILTVILFLLLLRRISRLKRILRTGPRVQALVTGISFVKDRGRVEFRYVHEGRLHDSGCAIMKNPTTEALTKDEQIEVAIDPANPKKALIVELFAR